MVYTGDLPRAATLQQDNVIVKEALTIFQSKLKRVETISVANLLRALRVDQECFAGVLHRHPILREMLRVMQNQQAIRANAGELKQRIEKILERQSA